MPYDDVQKFSEAAVNKAKLLKEHPGKYFLRAVMAGFFIVVAMIFSNVVGNTFQSTDPAWGKLLGGIVFAIAVLLIVFIGAELFTGNNLVMAFGAYDKKVSWAQVGKVWLVSYIGNFVGCLILSVIFVLAGASGTADYYAGFIGNKLSIPAGEMFFRAILCNFFVCLAVACGMKCKNEVAKFFMIILCITGFVVAGFEHCVANMFYIPAGIMAAMNPDYVAKAKDAYGLTAEQIATLTPLQSLQNFIPVTLGNMIGGMLCVGLPLYLIYKKKWN